MQNEQQINSRIMEAPGTDIQISGCRCVCVYVKYFPFFIGETIMIYGGSIAQEGGHRASAAKDELGKIPYYYGFAPVEGLT
jgi:hypothetical protein